MVTKAHPYVKGIITLIWDRAEPWEPASSVAQGWAITVLELIGAIRPNVLPMLLQSDPSRRLALPWLLMQGSLGPEAQVLASALMASSNPQDWEAAAAFLIDVTRDHIVRNEPPVSVPQFGSFDAQLIVNGILLTEIFNFGRSQPRPLDPEAASRWQSVVATTQGAVLAATATARNARQLLQSRGEDDTTLVALILGSATPASYKTLADAGDSLIRQYFRPLVRTEQQTERERLPYLGPLIINDLVNIWIQIDADENFFLGIAEELRCDEYAFEFTYSHYLTDRSRAMILAAIGSVAGVELKNEHLRLAALALADSLRSLPEGVIEPFDEATRKKLETQTGIVLPVK